ncbi:MAG: hypothetical protein RR734_02485 [Bacilli bacterium]
MKNKIFIISAACLLSVGLTSCESKITQDEAIALLNSYEPLKEFKDLHSIVYTVSTTTNGESTPNQIVHIDFKNLYYYSFEDKPLPQVPLEILIFKEDSQYTMCSSHGGGYVSITAPEARNYISAEKTYLDYLASFNANTILNFHYDGEITYAKKGNALMIHGTLVTETIESTCLTELNDRGLVTKDEINVTSPTTTETFLRKAEYNVAISKKTRL